MPRWPPLRRWKGPAWFLKENWAGGLSWQPSRMGPGKWSRRCSWRSSVCACRWRTLLRTPGVRNAMQCWTRTRITQQSVSQEVSGPSVATLCVTSFRLGPSGSACALRRRSQGCCSLNTQMTIGVASGGQRTFSFLFSMVPQLHLT